MRAPALLPVFIIVLLVTGTVFTGCAGLPVVPQGPSALAENSGDLRVYFFDVGQGDSSVLLLNDTVILIDAGEMDQGSRVVNYLRNLGVNHIDLLVATHPHSDHIGGMEDVLAAFPVETVLDSGIPHTSSVYGHFLETIRRQNIRYIVAERGQSYTPDPALRVLVLSPPETGLDGDLNANSIILKISYGTISFLFTGDAGTAAERELLMSGYSPRAQILKIAHHGSADATSAPFLSGTRPEMAVISLSQDNPYGYPHRETLDALRDAGITLYRTDRDGTILVRSDGTSYSVRTENSPGGLGDLPVPTIPANLSLPAIPEIPTNITIPVPPVSLPDLQIGNASLVRIDSVQFNAPGDDRVNLNGEWIRIKNTGPTTVLLSGWTLSDLSGADPYTFPAFLLLPERTVTICTGSGVMNDTFLFMGRSEPLWGNSGDTAVLRDGSGKIIDRQREGGAA